MYSIFKQEIGRPATCQVDGDFETVQDANRGLVKRLNSAFIGDINFLDNGKVRYSKFDGISKTHFLMWIDQREFTYTFDIYANNSAKRIATTTRVQTKLSAYNCIKEMYGDWSVVKLDDEDTYIVRMDGKTVFFVKVRS